MTRSVEAQGHFKIGEQQAEKAAEAFQRENQEEGIALSRQALDAYAKALELAPDDTEIQLSLGAQYFNTDETEKALALYEKAIDTLKNQEDSKNLLIQALTNQAGALFTIGKIKEADEVCDELLALDPGNQTGQQIKEACQAQSAK